jgi:hypothetical protein
MTPVKTAAHIRRENLELLQREFGTLDALAAKAETSAVYLSQVRHQSIDRKTQRPRQMGGSMARRLELAAGKPLGWMDIDHSEVGSSTEARESDSDRLPKRSEQTRVPVVGSAQIDQENFVVDTSAGGGFVVGLSSDEPDNLYAVRIMGAAPFGFLREGQFLVFERDGDPFRNIYFLIKVGPHPQLAELLSEKDGRTSVETLVGRKRLTFATSELTGGVDCVMSILSPGRFEPAHPAAATTF